MKDACVCVCACAYMYARAHVQKSLTKLNAGKGLEWKWVEKGDMRGGGRKGVPGWGGGGCIGAAGTTGHLFSEHKMLRQSDPSGHPPVPPPPHPPRPAPPPTTMTAECVASSLLLAQVSIASTAPPPPTTTTPHPPATPHPGPSIIPTPSLTLHDPTQPCHQTSPFSDFIFGVKV